MEWDEETGGGCEAIVPARFLNMLMKLYSSLLPVGLPPRNSTVVEYLALLLAARNSNLNWKFSCA